MNSTLKIYCLSLLSLAAANLYSSNASAKTVTSYTITIADPNNQFLGLQTKLYNQVKGAIEQWRSALVTKGTVRILVVPTNDSQATLQGMSVANRFIGYSSGIPVYEEGSAYVIRTGKNIDPTKPDMRIEINPAYLVNETWFDPQPLSRTAVVPYNKVDLVSLLVHEMGHAFGFNGFIDQTSGRTNPNYLSVFDTFIRQDSSGQVTFNGSNAMAIYGGPVPLTPGNYYHYGTNQTPALFYQLMNGIVFYYGTRYWIRDLDLGFMKDMGQTPRNWPLTTSAGI